MSEPPASRTIPSRSVSPTWPSSSRCSRCSGEKPRPSSVTSSRRPACERSSRTSTQVAPACSETLRSASCATRKTSASSSGAELVGARSRCGSRRHARVAGWRRPRARPRARRRAGWPGGSRPAACAGGGCCAAGRPPLRARATRWRRAVLRGHGLEAECDAGQVLHHAVVQIGGDAPTFQRRGLDCAHEQALALVLATAHAPRQAPGQRRLHHQQHDPRQQQPRCQRAQQPGAARLDAAAPLVELEEELLAVGPAQRQVDLEEGVLVALVAVLGLREIAHVASTSPVLSECSSSSPSGKRSPIRRGSSE